MGETHEVLLTCSSCGQDTEHELRYAGRLIASSRCSHCGYTIRHEQSDLRTAYIQDLEQRLVSKPTRILRRVLRHPVRFAFRFPASVLAKPAKMYGEIQPLLHDDPEDRQPRH